MNHSSFMQNYSLMACTKERLIRWNKAPEHKHDSGHGNAGSRHDENTKFACNLTSQEGE